MDAAKTRGGEKLDAVRALGERIDFGRTAGDYGRFRAGFPERFFDRLTSLGIIRAGADALDLGTGTGTLARGLARRVMRVTALDKSIAMTEEAARLDAEAGVSIRYVVGEAEATGLPTASTDLVTAGQCWHWFERPRAAREALRVLRAGGHLVIAHFDWIALPGSVVEATEVLIRAHNSEWNLWGGTGLYPPWMRDLGVCGFSELESFSFDVDAVYTHEAWRGRIRASAGVGAVMAPQGVAKFDAELKSILQE
ncbi:MAG: class I SAM-dependent methyltransferase, partial [Candidatus Binataceae bacterium]